MAEVYTLTNREYPPEVGNILTEGNRFGIITEVLDVLTVKVAWQERKPKSKRRTVHHVDTAKKHGCAWLVSQDTMSAVNAAYA